MDPDSSFLFSDCESVISKEENTDFALDDDEAEIDNMLDESSEEDSSIGDEEIWEDASDDETGPRRENCIWHMPFSEFFYRVSERAILALLLFLRSMLTFFGLQHIAQLLPRSLQSIKKVFRINLPRQKSVEYVVCPK